MSSSTNGEGMGEERKTGFRIDVAAGDSAMAGRHLSLYEISSVQHRG